MNPQDPKALKLAEEYANANGEAYALESELSKAITAALLITTWAIGVSWLFRRMRK